MQFILFFICQCFWIGFQRKGKHLTVFLFNSQKKRQKNLTKEKWLHTSKHASVCIHHINTDTICMKCAQWILNLQFSLSLSLSHKSLTQKKLKNFNVYARVRWNGVNQFQYIICSIHDSYVAEKGISHCEYHSLWHARNMPKKMTHTWRYFRHKLLVSVFSISYEATIKIEVYRLCIQNKKSFACWVCLNNIK